jgi:hypothetical protein
VANIYCSTCLIARYGFSRHHSAVTAVTSSHCDNSCLS